MRALSLAGMDGAVLGNHEFDLGAKNLFEKIDNWAHVPAARGELRVGRSAAGAVDADGRSLRDVVPPFEIYDVEGPQGRRDRHGQHDHDHVDLRGRQLARLPADRRRATRSSSYVRAPAPGRSTSSSWSATSASTRTRASPRRRSTIRTRRSARDARGRRPDPRRPPPHRHEPAEADPERRAEGHNDDRSSTRARSRSSSAGSTSSCTSATNNGDPGDAAAASRRSAYDNIPVDSKRQGVPASRTIRTIANLMWPYSVKLNQEIDLNGVFAYVDSRAGRDAKITAQRSVAAATRSSATWSRARCSCSRASRPSSRSRTRSASAPTSSAARSRSSRCTTCSRSRTRSP